MLKKKKRKTFVYISKKKRISSYEKKNVEKNFG